MNISETTERAATLSELRELLSSIDGVPEATTVALENMEAEGASYNPDKSKLQQMYGSFMTAIAVKLADQSFTGVAEPAIQLGTLITS